MKHEYSPQQIEEACDLASKGYTRIGINFLLDFLGHLPEPATDDWQECRFEDIQIGDRVKVVDTHEAGDQTVYEGDVVQVSKGLVMTAHHQLHSVYNSKWYRIPAPVQHPNPDEHELIFVFALKTHDYMVSDGRQLMIWDGEHYVNSENMVRPESITEWSPAEAEMKVVEDDR